MFKNTCEGNNFFQEQTTNILCNKNDWTNANFTIFEMISSNEIRELRTALYISAIAFLLVNSKE